MLYFHFSESVLHETQHDEKTDTGERHALMQGYDTLGRQPENATGDQSRMPSVV